MIGKPALPTGIGAISAVSTNRIPANLHPRRNIDAIASQGIESLYQPHQRINASTNRVPSSDVIRSQLCKPINAC
jgi:hypothetical protein